ncbi:predicted protein [Nematostella vectensis]|uniref:G protein pathway suppressor 2 n=1 Tax=Nematostella vectensis TaxID=45351 RepID=A7S4P6_NEMVE|nr:predicted protein [Nematostella vectensis]|eukprot:XP_001633420.1 predicted protein [Nematostella vectensis]
MPVLLERKRPSRKQLQAVHAHIIRQREKEKQLLAESRAKEEEEKKRKREVEKKKETVEDVKIEIEKLKTKLESLKNEKHQMFLQLKKVLSEDEEKRQRERQAALAAMPVMAPRPFHAVMGGPRPFGIPTSLPMSHIPVHSLTRGDLQPSSDRAYSYPPQTGPIYQPHGQFPMQAKHGNFPASSAFAVSQPSAPVPPLSDSARATTGPGQGQKPQGPNQTHPALPTPGHLPIQRSHSDPQTMYSQVPAQSHQQQNHPLSTGKPPEQSFPLPSHLKQQPGQPAKPQELTPQKLPFHHHNKGYDIQGPHGKPEQKQYTTHNVVPSAHPSQVPHHKSEPHTSSHKPQLWVPPTQQSLHKPDNPHKNPYHQSSITQQAPKAAELKAAHPPSHSPQTQPPDRQPSASLPAQYQGQQPYAQGPQPQQSQHMAQNVSYPATHQHYQSSGQGDQGHRPQQNPPNDQQHVGLGAYPPIQAHPTQPYHMQQYPAQYQGYQVSPDPAHQQQNYQAVPPPSTSQQPGQMHYEQAHEKQMLPPPPQRPSKTDQSQPSGYNQYGDHPQHGLSKRSSHKYHPYSYKSHHHQGGTAKTKYSEKNSGSQDNHGAGGSSRQAYHDGNRSSHGAKGSGSRHYKN